MQNLLMAAQSIAEQGAIYLPLGDSRMGLIDSRDIAEFAAKVLTTPGHEGKTYTITGPVSITMHEVAEVIGGTIKKEVKYVPITLEDAWKAMVNEGMDEWTVNLLCDYFSAYSTNWGDLVTDDFQRVLGKPPRTLADFANDFSNAFVKS